MRPNGGWSSSGTQYMQSATGQYGTQAGEPAQPVQHSVMTASSLGFFFRGVAIPSDFGSLLITVAVMLELCHTQRLICFRRFHNVFVELATGDIVTQYRYSL